MQIENLGSGATNNTIETDLVIIGGGPAGLTIAREFFQTSTRVLILESGELKEEPRFSQLNTVESIGQPKSPAQMQKRIELVADSCPSWSNESQKFGVRCRVLGGSSHAWAGKSTVFDDVDFAEREWVPYSGWPFGLETFAPYVDRAANALNLGPNCYDSAVWDLLGIGPPAPELDPKVLDSWFWQFARSRINNVDVLRLGPEFITFDAPNVSVLLNATVTRIDTDITGATFEALEVSDINGARLRVRAKAAVLAAGAIENARLLLVSNRLHPKGLGNQNDLVGRFLMDHPSGTLGRFRADDAPVIIERFGFYGLKHRGRTYIYSHGLVLSKELQKREKLLHCAAYMAEEHAPDDPLNAFKRLLRGKSEQPISDIIAVASGPGLLVKGFGMRLVKSNVVPHSVRDFVVDIAIKLNPNLVVREFQSHGLPHKLKGVVINGVTEQIPDPESRITLSEKTDALGLPMPQIDWRIDDKAQHSLIRLGHLIAAELPRAGLPRPVLEDWISRERPEDGDITDIAHTSGTTRMSDDPRRGVVNSKCQVHGIAGLYVTGASVFPTSGHANPTLMILSLAIRLADQIKTDLKR